MLYILDEVSSIQARSSLTNCQYKVNGRKYLMNRSELVRYGVGTVLGTESTL